VTKLAAVDLMLVALLAACPPHEPAPPPRDPTMVMPPRVTVTCMPAGTSKLTNVIAEGTRVRYCIADTDQCFAIDPDVADVKGFVKTDKPPAAVSGAYVETTQPRIEVCNSADCTSLTDKVLPAAAKLRAATTTDGAFAAVLFGAYVEIWDVATTPKKLSTIKRPCENVAMLGQTVLLRCGAQATLYSLSGKKLADAGGKGFAVSSYVPVDGNLWAFLDERGTRVAVQDVAAGKVVKSIDTSGLFMIGAAQAGNPGESSLTRLADGRLVVIAGRPAIGSVAAIDPKTGALDLRQAPPCR
jgi:hypothetical protein